MRDGGKRTLVGSSFLPGCELLLNEEGDQLFSLNRRQFNRTFDLAVHQELHLEEIGQGGEKRVAPRAKQLLDSLVVSQSLLELFLRLQCCHRLEELVDLDDQIVEAGDVGKKTLWNYNATVVLAGFSSLVDDVTDVVHKD